MKVAYCDCVSGISGDMFMGALIDLGLPLNYLEDQIRLLGLPDRFRLESTICMKGALRARQFKVVEGENADLHTSHHRHYADIIRLIDESGLSQPIKTNAQRIFHVLAEAEAQVHGSSIAEVHFHEVGALDSIIDIVGASIGLDYFGIEKVFGSSVPWGGGEIQSQHGRLPLPAPATLEVLKAASAQLRPVPYDVELVTPTGAAILAALAVFERPAFTLNGVGIGAGGRDFPEPNIFRLLSGETLEVLHHPLIVIETNIDDMNPEFYGLVMEKLFKAGALDVYLVPIQMKKNRPGTMLGLVGRYADEHRLAKIILEETSSLGVRIYPVYRYEASRIRKLVSTSFGDLHVKCKILNGKIIHASPEYEDCKAAAEKKRVPIQRVFTEVIALSQHMLE